MPSNTLETVRTALETGGPRASADALIASLREQRDYDRLFDALLIRARLELGLPVVKPTAFDDVPADKQAAFEQAYITAARDVGRLHLEAGNIARAWSYFRTIREPQPVTEALDSVDANGLHDYERTNELIEIALHDGANRVAGLRFLLATHGTCNTVTMTDQVLPMMSVDERRRAAAMLVRDVYETLTGNIKRDIESRVAGSTAPESLREQIAGRDWLFEGGNYHIDVSHLHSVVRFARALSPADPEFAQALELAEYGSRLDQQLRYPAEAPFDDYYAAHVAYFRAIGNEKRDESLDYFRERLKTEAEDRDRQITAYVLVDLLQRCERFEEAAEVAAKHLADLEEPGGFSFASLCARAGRLDLLRDAAQAAEDPVRYTAALIEAGSQSNPS